MNTQTQRAFYSRSRLLTSTSERSKTPFDEFANYWYDIVKSRQSINLLPPRINIRFNTYAVPNYNYIVIEFNTSNNDLLNMLPFFAAKRPKISINQTRPPNTILVQSTSEKELALLCNDWILGIVDKYNIANLQAYKNRVVDIEFKRVLNNVYAYKLYMYKLQTGKTPISLKYIPRPETVPAPAPAIPILAPPPAYVPYMQKSTQTSRPSGGKQTRNKRGVTH